ncbi:MAG TPA: asparagine synthase (glutamine-hydrolyzing) [Candidatus Enterenecus stercoripullorum]|nr:asparagine synthase (glutamine-hydrolyzing) [Candidatus Enterenecus stercoripullorum]
MCGFTGFVSRSAPDVNALHAMGDAIRHRGPDEEGHYVDGHCAIAHRRLSIIDLANGHQPMSSPDGRYVLAYNGEIYNYQQLRTELSAAGHTFRTNSDTEVLLHGYMQWGAQVTGKLRGMFAFVIWDRQRQELFGARDPFGIKPFYYAIMGDLFFFGSEAKSFLPHPQFKKELNGAALKFYLTFQYSALNESFFKNVYRLLPGHQFFYRDGHVEFSSYNQFSFDPQPMPLYKRAEQIREVVTESVKAHEISDVEVGAFLSGGIDSSVITALSRPDKTYSVGFANKGFDETSEAKALCQELGLRNLSKTISPEEFFAALPAIQYYADEPNANLSTVPLYFLSQLAAKDVKVVLSGEGSDELFGGYITYHTTRPYRAYRKLPKGLRKAVAAWAAKRRPFHGQGFLLKAAKEVEEYFVGQAFIFDNDEAQRVLKPEFRRGLTWRDITAPYFAQVKDADDLTKMQYLDLHMWQPLDILRKADRMTMAHSLELRVPYLDREVWAVARAIPSSQKMRGKSTTKYPLRVAAEAMLPEDWVRRPKMGFPVPFVAWLQEEKYYNWAKELLSQEYVSQFFDRDYLLDLLEQHYTGKKHTHRKLYTVLSFLIWYQVYFPEKCGVRPFRPGR